MKHIKYFEEKASYDSYISSSDAILPNVSYVEDVNEVFYNVYINNELPNNVIRYYSSKKETIPDYGEIPEIVSHEFSDGVGIITFKGGLEYCPSVFDNNIYESNWSITRIELPNTITTIGGSAFDNCMNLVSINIPNSLTVIEGYAFRDCYNLNLEEDSLVNIKYLGNQSLVGVNINTVNLPNINYIDELVFKNANITNITIGKDCEFIGFCTFTGTGLDTINYEGTMEQFLMMKKSPSWYKKGEYIGDTMSQQIYTVRCSDGDIDVSDTYDEGYYDEGYDEGYYE